MFLNRASSTTRCVFNSMLMLPSRAISTQSDILMRVDSILAGDRSALSRTVTLIESARQDHRDVADSIMSELISRTPHRRN